MEVKTNFCYDGHDICLSGDIKKNLLTLDHVDYFAAPLSDLGNKGGHSFVFKLFEAQTYEDDSDPVRVIKIDKFKKNYNGTIKGFPKKSRFQQEIEAMKICQQAGKGNVMTLFCDGYLICKNNKGVDAYAFPFYVMEYAESDLKDYMSERRDNIDDAGKIELCLNLAEGLNDLYSLGIYHRDIKPDNVFLVDGKWKIGDLGLIALRNKPTLDTEGEFVGPRGWISPEAMNKYLSEGVEGLDFDCAIDHQSDLFQLAKVFWFILQGNAPIGGIESRDFKFHNDEMYSLLKHMLNHSKKRRPATINDVILRLQQIVKKYYM